MTGYQGETLTLGAERDRLAESFDEIDRDLEDVEPGSSEHARLLRERNDVDQMGQAVNALITGDESQGFDGYGPGAEITVKGLDAAEYAETINRADDAAQQAATKSIRGTGGLITAAYGLVDAPFLGDGHPFIDDTLDPTDPDDRLRAFGAREDEKGLPPGVRKWVADLVSERSQLGEKNWRRSAGPTQDTGSGT